MLRSIRNYLECRQLGIDGRLSNCVALAAIINGAQTGTVLKNDCPLHSGRPFETAR
jgi:hypothetical protein